MTVALHQGTGFKRQSCDGLVMGLWTVTVFQRFSKAYHCRNPALSDPDAVAASTAADYTLLPLLCFVHAGKSLLGSPVPRMCSSHELTEWHNPHHLIMFGCMTSCRFGCMTSCRYAQQLESLWSSARASCCSCHGVCSYCLQQWLHQVPGGLQHLVAASACSLPCVP